MSVTGVLVSVAAFVLVIGPLVFVHELGHYLAGRWFGVKAEEFSIGFGRELFGINDRRGTRWKFSLLPIGGYVRFAGDMDMSSREDPAWKELPLEIRDQTFPSKSVWQRAIIVAAGPLTNLLVAFVILAGFGMVYGKIDPQAYVGKVVVGSPAARAGLAAGDRIVAMGGKPVAQFADIFDFVRARPGATVPLRIDRGGASMERSVTIGSVAGQDEAGRLVTIGQIGISPRAIAVGPVEASLLAGRGIGSIMGSMGDLLGQIVIGQRSVKELGGPLRIAQVSGQQMEAGVSSMVWLIALISINLGFINLLPVPVLDGGHLLFYAIEAVRRRPVEPAVQEWAFRGGLAAVLGLMVLVTFNDLGAFGLWKSLTGLIG